MSYAPRIPTAQWELHKKQIRTLYLVEDNTLDQTIKIMTNRYGFSATDKQYVRKLKNWGMKKNVRSHQWKKSVSLVQGRKALGKETKLIIDGMNISAKRMKKEMSRYSYLSHGLGGLSGNIPQQNFGTVDYILTKSPLVVSADTSLGVIAHTPPSDNPLLIFLNTPWIKFQSSMESFLGATRLNNVNFVRMLLIGGANPSSADIDGRNPSTVLNIAAQEHNLRIVDLLLSCGADPNDSGHSEYTILDSFWNCNGIEDNDSIIPIMEILIKAGGRITPNIDRILEASLKIENFKLIELLLESASELKESPASTKIKLQWAIERNELEMVQVLNNHGVDVNCLSLRFECSPKIMNKFSCWTTPIAIAAKKDYVDMTQLLLNLGADANVMVPWDHLATRTATQYRQHIRPWFVEHGPKPALHQAAWNGNKFMVEMLLNHGANIHLTDYFGYTPLQRACESNHLDVVRVLLSYGANADKTVLRGATEHGIGEVAGILLFHILNTNSSRAALEAAVEVGSIELVTTLLKAGPHPHPMSIHDAVSTPRKSVEIVKLLLDAGASVDEVSCCDSTRTPLQMAVRQNDLKLVNLLLQYGADIRYVKGTKPRSSRDNSTTQQESDRIEIVLALLQQGVDINSYSLHADSCTFLEAAIEFHNFSVVELLLDQGANPTQCRNSSDKSLLHSALEHAYFAEIGIYEPFPFEIFNALISHGADVNIDSFVAVEMFVEDIMEMTNFYSQYPFRDMETTPLQSAVMFALDDAVRLLLQNGADINNLPEEGLEFTPLQMAIVLGHGELIEALLESGAHINTPARAEIGFTALQAAILTNNNDLTQRLLDAGAEIDAPASSERGITALQAAAFKDNDEITQALLSRNPNVNAPPCRVGGATALQYAAINGNLDLVVQLLEKGADINAAPSDKEGRTALQGAAEHGRLDIVHLLLENDGEVDFLEERCKEAAEFADVAGHRTIANILRNWERPLY
ncbi:hypothetical protein G7Z17_g3661 [Cylindrodendrum hubeiense]|uniref:Clr5 domain-containing protein n=1 Tax=Cylindrodendrum hubeiense TaxID=595255 RepID=A0A9P5LJ55_9HYPO|nr:hypothetical protein G7Z17_g3661 [Cylindrodendrum hubeiense]